MGEEIDDEVKEKIEPKKEEKKETKAAVKEVEKPKPKEKGPAKKEVEEPAERCVLSALWCKIVLLLTAGVFYMCNSMKYKCLGTAVRVI